MKTRLFTCKLILFLLCFGALESKAQSFQKKQVDVNIGLGVGNTFIDAGAYSALPPISLAVEVGITNDISLGGYLAFAGATYKYSDWEHCPHFGGDYYYTDTHSWTYVILGIRGAYHFGRFIKIDKLDVYAGLMLGNDFAKDSYTTNSPCQDHFDYYSRSYGGGVVSLFAGARYRFTDHVGIFGELGYGISLLNIGLNLKF
jgi:hypothetical protein